MDLLGVFKRVLQRHASDIEALNKKQLTEGKRSDGLQVDASGYSKRHRKARIRRGRQVDHVDLNFTGAFYNKVYSLYFDKFMELGSKDSKTDVLEDSYSTKIFGLTPKSRIELLDSGVRQEFVQEFKKELLRNVKNELFR
jgi:hypothetical protein